MTRMPIEISNLSPQEKRQLLEKMLREKAAFRMHPASYGQRGMWFLHQLAPQSAAYNTGLAVRILSDIDQHAFQQAFQTLVNRHAALRTTFLIENGQVVQRIHGSMDLSPERIDVSDWPEASLEQAVQQSCARPFDLENGPLIRVSLFTRAPQDHVLLLAIHHIVFDGHSFWILLDEFRALYEAECSGRPHSLPALRTTYTDFVDWQQTLLSGPEGEQHWEYWKNQLAGIPSALELPTDRSCPPHQLFEGESLPIRLSAELSSRVKEFAGSEGVTLFVTLLSAFQILLYRYASQDEIVVGTPTSGRTRAEFAGVLGNFVNMVPLRAHLQAGLPFRQFLQQVRRSVLEALEHQEFPFPVLVERLGAGRNPGQSPIFQTTFGLHKALRSDHSLAVLDSTQPGATFRWGRLVLAPFPLRQQEGQFDLTLELIDDGEFLSGNLKYNTHLFGRAAVERMSGHFQTLLQGILEDPSCPLSELPFLSASEREQILSQWNHTLAEDPPYSCVHQLIEACVETAPAAIAVVSDDRQYRYQELNERSNRLAHYLIQHQVRPGTLVAVSVERSAEMVVALLAVLKSGAAYVPLDPDSPPERLNSMLQDSGAAVLLTEQAMLHQLPGFSGHTICPDRDAQRIAEESSQNPRVPMTPDDLAYVIYTSGSTGKPKGVEIPHRALVNFLTSMCRTPGIASNDVWLAVAPLSFDPAGMELFLPLIAGARVVVAGRHAVSDGVALARLVTESGATIMQGTPSTWEFLLTAGWEGKRDLRMLCGGDGLPGDLALRLLQRGRELWNLYGPTETTICATLAPVERVEKRISIGKPIRNTFIYILDVNGQPVPPGIPGELHIGGDGLARGYLNRPELTKQKFIANPFIASPGSRLYKTADLAQWRPDGRIDWLGRLDEQVKIRGHRIELGEVETVLRGHAAVKDAVVVARETQPGERSLVAYIIARTDQKPDPHALHGSLKEKLPEYMIPAAFVLLDRFPLTPNGKVDRRALLAAPGAELKNTRHYVAPRTPTEKAVADVLADVLGADQLGVDDNFFDLGGHSLLATRALARIQRIFKIQVPLGTFFDAPTAGGLARHLEALTWLQQDSRNAPAPDSDDREELVL